jgi:ABC-type transporter Mla MlaB component
MKIFMNGSRGQLQGDLTESGPTGSCVGPLSDSLQKIETGGARTVRIDCGRVLRADLEGLRILYTWMQCARFRGIELELVNLSDCLRQAMRNLSPEYCFTG